MQKRKAMRSDREGLEDTRCCDIKPATGIFSPGLSIQYRQLVGEQAVLRQNRVMQRSHDIAEGETLYRETLYKQYTQAE